MAKSHVSMEQHQCFACGELYDTGTVLLDRRLKDSLEDKTVTDYGLCATHQKLVDRDFVILIECADDDKENRTGRLGFINKKIFKEMFDEPVVTDPPIVFITDGMIAELEQLARACDALH